MLIALRLGLGASERRATRAAPTLGIDVEEDLTHEENMRDQGDQGQRSDQAECS